MPTSPTGFPLGLALAAALAMINAEQCPCPVCEVGRRVGGRVKRELKNPDNPLHAKMELLFSVAEQIGAAAWSACDHFCRPSDSTSFPGFVPPVITDEEIAESAKLGGDVLRREAVTAMVAAIRVATTNGLLDERVMCEKFIEFIARDTLARITANRGHRAKGGDTPIVTPAPPVDSNSTGAGAGAGDQAKNAPYVESDGTFHCSCGATHRRGPVNGRDYRCLKCGETSRSPVIEAKTYTPIYAGKPYAEQAKRTYESLKGAGVCSGRDDDNNIELIRESIMKSIHSDRNGGTLDHR